MANYLRYKPATPLTPDQVRKPMEALRDGILRGKVEVEDHGQAWTLRRPGLEPYGPPMRLYLDEDGLSWSTLANREDEWLLFCVACVVVRGIDPDATVVDECNDVAIVPDFDRRYPTLKSYLRRPTGSWLLDAAGRVADALSPKQPYDDIDMAPAPF